MQRDRRHHGPVTALGDLQMSIRNVVVRALMATSLAVGGVLMSGRSAPLHAQDTSSCILGGTGVLCYTKQVQTCTDWKFVSFGAGASLSMTITCAQWETTTQYYYRDGGGTPTKPGLK
jgi:hypothetical protein